jgi:hypothetical protein
MLASYTLAFIFSSIFIAPKKIVHDFIEIVKDGSTCEVRDYYFVNSSVRISKCIEYKK